MGPGETMVVIALVALVIVVVGILPDLYKRRLAYKTRVVELEAQKAIARAAPAADGDRLEARVRVLERIATDRSGDLATRIEQLRDPAEAYAREVN